MGYNVGASMIRIGFGGIVYTRVIIRNPKTV